MVNIAFIVGKGSDIYPLKVTSKKAPLWLKSGKYEFTEFINDDNTVPSDVALALYIQYNYKNANVTCINGHKADKFKQTLFDKQDIIFVIFDAIEIFHCGIRKTCPTLATRVEKMLANTTAFVYPHPDFHKYIIHKPQYYKDLKRAGIPIAPFFSVTPKGVIHNVDKFKEYIINKGWKGVIIKPSYAGYSMGIKVFKNIARVNTSTILKHFIKLEKKGFPDIVIQEFIPSFGSNYEIRTYWMNQKYAYSVGTLTEAVGGGDSLPVTGFDTFVSEGGNIPDIVLKRLKPVAKKVFETLPQYPVKHPLVRIDFGCCLKTNDCIESYFVNEVETMAANLLIEHTDYPVIEKLSPILYKFSLKMKGTKNLQGKRKQVEKLTKNPCN